MSSGISSDEIKIEGLKFFKQKVKEMPISERKAFWRDNKIYLILNGKMGPEK